MQGAQEEVCILKTDSYCCAFVYLTVCEQGKAVTSTYNVKAKANGLKLGLGLQ